MTTGGTSTCTCTQRVRYSTCGISGREDTRAKKDGSLCINKKLARLLALCSCLKRQKTKTPHRRRHRQLAHSRVKRANTDSRMNPAGCFPLTQLGANLDAPSVSSPPSQLVLPQMHNHDIRL